MEVLEVVLHPYIGRMAVRMEVEVVGTVEAVVVGDDGEDDGEDGENEKGERTMESYIRPAHCCSTTLLLYY